MATKLPAFFFYPADWLKDPVSGCSLAAQGLWLRMMLLMHNSERYGYLAANGSPIPPEIVARSCGCDTPAQYETLLAELDSAAVPSRTPTGIIYSRRMVRDAGDRAREAERKRKKRDESEKRPAFVRRLSAPREVEDGIEVSDTPEIPMPNCLLTEAFKAKWAEYIEYRRSKRLAALLPESVRRQWGHLAEFGHDGAIASIEQTIRNGWQGLFPPKDAPKPTSRPKGADPYTEPEGWRETLRDVAQARRWDRGRVDEMCRGEWLDLSTDLRADIHKNHKP